MFSPITNHHRYFLLLLPLLEKNGHADVYASHKLYRHKHSRTHLQSYVGFYVFVITSNRKMSRKYQESRKLYDLRRNETKLQLSQY